jgi:hypothetical protein
MKERDREWGGGGKDRIKRRGEVWKIRKVDKARK